MRQILLTMAVALTSCTACNAHMSNVSLATGISFGLDTKTFAPVFIDTGFPEQLESNSYLNNDATGMVTIIAIETPEDRQAFVLNLYATFATRPQFVTSSLSSFDEWPGAIGFNTCAGTVCSVFAIKFGPKYTHILRLMYPAGNMPDSLVEFMKAIK